jgi:hypothetical protein
MNQHILQGPFLTRAEASRLSHVPDRFLVHRHDLLHIGGRWLPEVYFAFQFDEHGVRPEFAHVVDRLKERYGDREICEWLATPQPELGFATPISFLNAGGDPELVLEAAVRDGPVSPAAATSDRSAAVEPPDTPPSQVVARPAGSRRRTSRMPRVRIVHSAR